MSKLLALLPAEDERELDKLVNYGVFNDKSDAIIISVKLLVRQDEIKKEDLIKCMRTVNKFLMDNIGDLPFPSYPLVIHHNSEKVYKFPIKTRIDWGKNMIIGFVCIGSGTFEIIPDISDSAEKLNKVCEKIGKDIESSLSEAGTLV